MLWHSISYSSKNQITVHKPCNMKFKGLLLLVHKNSLIHNRWLASGQDEDDGGDEEGKQFIYFCPKKHGDWSISQNYMFYVLVYLIMTDHKRLWQYNAYVCSIGAL